jgi:hypothetical protein
MRKLAPIFISLLSMVLLVGISSCSSSTSALGISTPVLPDGELNIAYSQTLAATGGSGTYTWSVAGGTLPVGLSLAPSGVISGIPTTAGTSSLTFQLTDSKGSSVSEDISITIDATLSFLTTSLPDGAVNDAYSQEMDVYGGNSINTWSIISGALPAGLSLGSSTGIISGTPTATGSSSFTVQVTDSNGATATQAGSITIESAFSITTTTLPDGTVNTAYSQTLAASGGSGTYTAWAISSGSLPAGLSLASSTGIISGTPTASGASSFTVQITDSNGASATQSLSINIDAASTTSASTTSAGS